MMEIKDFHPFEGKKLNFNDSDKRQRGLSVPNNKNLKFNFGEKKAINYGPNPSIEYDKINEEEKNIEIPKKKKKTVKMNEMNSNRNKNKKSKINKVDVLHFLEKNNSMNNPIHGDNEYFCYENEKALVLEKEEKAIFGGRDMDGYKRIKLLGK